MGHGEQQEHEEETLTSTTTTTQQEEEEEEQGEGEEEEEEEEEDEVVVEDGGACKRNQQQRQRQQQNLVIREVSERLLRGDLRSQIEAAREIRRLVRKSTSPKTRCKLAASGVIEPLISMLLSSHFDARHSSLLALLNLAVRNERSSSSPSISNYYSSVERIDRCMK